MITGSGPKWEAETFKVGDKLKMELSFSEVCMHMNVAGKVMTVEILDRGVQLYDDEGNKFSFPITHNEAGVYLGQRDENDVQTYYVPKEHVK